MKRLLIMLLAAMIFAGCTDLQKLIGGGAPAPPGPNGAPPPGGLPNNTPSGPATNPNACDYTGTWDSDWGTMVIVQSGSAVTGNYTHDSGRITATVSGGKLTGKWSEYPSYSEPNDAGDVELTMSGCNSFSGSWRYGSGAPGAAWSGTWTATRIS